MKPIGILGGTFDPVHNGHLRLAIEFYERLDLEEVRFVPLRVPPHRETPLADPEQRMAMLTAAIKNITGIIIDDCELRRESISYTIDTVSAVRASVGQIPICLLMGMDAFATIQFWHRWTDLLQYVHIAIADRPVRDSVTIDPNITVFLNEHSVNDAAVLHQTPAGKIFSSMIPMLDISASRIRNMISKGRDPHGLLPEGVLEFIRTNNLYSNT